MAGKRIDIMDLRQLIRLKQSGKSNRSIAELLSVNRNTVNTYVRRIVSYDLNYDELLSLEDAALYDLFPSASEVDHYRYKELSSHFDEFVTKLRIPGCTMETLWHEYLKQHPDGYMKTQFYYHFKKWRSKKRISGKLDHKYGENIFVDFTGKKLRIVNKETGAIEEVEVFVAILPASNYTFVTATKSQRKEDVVWALTKMFSYFGGVPKAIVSDNLKSVVTKSHKYAPKINLTIKDLAMHYGCVINPTRAHAPQDKALVEGAVKLVYQRIFYPLSKHTFFSLESLNEQIAILNQTYNAYKFSQREGSRVEEYFSLEKSYLSELPTTRYELREFRKLTVQKMGYVYLSKDKHYYSVPYRYIGNQVWLCYSHDTVEIFYKKQRIAYHKRDYKKGVYTTVKEHLSSSHKAYSQWSLSYFQQMASNIGEHTHDYITLLINQRSYPEIAYKQALGIIMLHKSYDKERLENACKRAHGYGKHSYHMIERILRKELDKSPDDPAQTTIPLHQNIRGVGYYN